MPTNVIMPQLGESVVEGTISRWLKQEGDTIHEFEPLLEVSTDKVDTEVPAPASGVLLKIHVPEGETVERGTLLAIIGQADEKITEDTPPAGTRHDVSAHDTRAPTRNHPATQQVSAAFNAPPSGHMLQDEPSNGQNGYTGHMTPVVARMVSEYNIDLSRVKGTGRGGRITKKDVEAYLAQRESAPEAVAEELPPWEQPGEGSLFKPTVEYDSEPAEEVGTRHVVSESQPTMPPRVHAVEPIPEAADGEMVRLNAMRRSIAEHMVRSKHTSPHVTTVFEIDMSAVLAHREVNKDAFAKQGVNLTLTAYFVAATVEALRAMPILNSQWTEEGIYQHRAINIGIAVALEQGLIVPVIKNAQDLNLLGIARAVNDLASRARNRQLKPDEVQGGTFSITNHGVSGSLFATPIINQPQAGILGVGLMEKRVKVITDTNGNDMIAIRPCVYVSLTFDHRIADGATADGFLLTLKQRMEGWSD
jgi:2-oxoglutarate dehydrogenase E2 component (dihydrolipoamide succinyltransferase)